MKFRIGIFRNRAAKLPAKTPRNLREAPGVMRKTDSVLRKVLATYEAEESFLQALTRVLEGRDHGSSAQRAPFFLQLLNNHTRPEDQGKNHFTIARHILEDLKEVYGFRLP